MALEYVIKILCLVLSNAIASITSERKHFRINDFVEITQDIFEHKSDFERLCPRWNNNDQKHQFIRILKNQVHLYTHFLTLIVRYVAVSGKLHIHIFSKNSDFSKVLSFSFLFLF